MADALGAVSEAVENIPGFGVVSDAFTTIAPDIIKTKDPFYEKVDGKEVRRKPPPAITDEQRKLWKRVVKRAWYHDRNFCNCFPIDLGLGIIPIITILPVIGPWICYTMHGELIKYAADAGAPKKVLAKMGGNVTFDFLISICPVLGTIFCWMNACSTKNAALFDTWMRNQAAVQEDRTKTATSLENTFRQDHERRMQMQTRPPGRPGQAPEGRREPPTTLEQAQAQDLAARMNQQPARAAGQQRPTGPAQPNSRQGRPPPQGPPPGPPAGQPARPPPAQAPRGPPRTLEEAQAQDLAMRMAQRQPIPPAHVRPVPLPVPRSHSPHGPQQRSQSPQRAYPQPPGPQGAYQRSQSPQRPYQRSQSPQRAYQPNPQNPYQPVPQPGQRAGSPYQQSSAASQRSQSPQRPMVLQTPQPLRTQRSHSPLRGQSPQPPYQIRSESPMPNPYGQPSNEDLQTALELSRIEHQRQQQQQQATDLDLQRAMQQSLRDQGRPDADLEAALAASRQYPQGSQPARQYPPGSMRMPDPY